MDVSVYICSCVCLRVYVSTHVDVFVCARACVRTRARGYIILACMATHGMWLTACVRMHGLMCTMSCFDVRGRMHGSVCGWLCAWAHVRVRGTGGITRENVDQNDACRRCVCRASGRRAQGRAVAPQRYEALRMACRKSWRCSAWLLCTHGCMRACVRACVCVCVCVCVPTMDCSVEEGRIQNEG